MNDDNIMNSAGRYTTLFLAVGTVFGGFLLYNRISRVAKEVDDVKKMEKNLLEKLTAQLANHTDTARDIINVDQ
jgi:hypothetical protein